MDGFNTSLSLAANWSAGHINRSVGYPGPSTSEEALKYITLVLYLITFCAGLFGNGLVIYILIRFKSVRSKSVANIYILNLSVADLVFIFTMPLFCYATYTKDWIFGNPMCKITFVFREINKFGSIFTLMALSVDRFLASFHTLSYLRTNQVGKYVCLGVWVASFAMCTPYIMYSYSVNSRGKSTCKINWPVIDNISHMKAWSYSQLTIGLIVPVFVILVSYLLLMHRLKAIMKFRQAQRAKKPSRKMTKTIAIVVVIFLVCQVPYYILDMVSVMKREKIHLLALEGIVYQPAEWEWSLFVYCNALAQMLVFISSCCNPVIYGVTNDNFSK